MARDNQMGGSLSRKTQSQSVLERGHMGNSVAFSLLLPNLGSQMLPQNFSSAYNPTEAATGAHDTENLLYKMEKRIQRGNRSRDAVSWIGGTQPQEMRLQRVPGYQGF